MNVEDSRAVLKEAVVTNDVDVREVEGPIFPSHVVGLMTAV